MKTSEILKKPLITEKSSVLSSQGRYVFEVASSATKSEIKKAIEKAFKVKVVDVKTIRVKGKKRRLLKSRKQITKSPWKKAILTLKEGDKINLFEGGA